MYPQDPSDNVDILNPSTPPGASRELVTVSNAVGTANGDEGMDESYSLGIVEVEDSEDLDSQESRLAKEVAEKRKKRARAIEEEMARVEEASRQFTEATRKEEMLRVREACLPGLVFMTHEVRDMSRCEGEGYIQRTHTFREGVRRTRALSIVIRTRNLSQAA